MKYFILLFLIALLSACNDTGDSAGKKRVAPVAEKHPFALRQHGDTRVDNYHWLRDDSRSDAKVLKHLRSENEYTSAVMAHTESLQERLYQEITARLNEEDRSLPVRSKNYEYYREFKPGLEHPIYLRRAIDLPDGKPAVEVAVEKDPLLLNPQVLVDVNQQAVGYDFYRIGSWQVSHGEDILAYTEDTIGRRQYRLHVKDIESGQLFEGSLDNVSQSLAWAADNKTLFYVKKHPVTLLPYQVYRHRLGDDHTNDVLVHEERREGFYTWVYRDRSEKYVVIVLSSTTSTEVRLIDAYHPESKPVTFLPQESGHEYRLRYAGEHFYVLTNHRAKNFKLMKVHKKYLGDPDRIRETWQEIVPHDAQRLIEDVEVFDQALVINDRYEGLSYIRVLDAEGVERASIEFPDPVYTVSLYSNPEPSAPVFRYIYNSLTSPETIYEYDFASGGTTVARRETVQGNFDPALYQSERLWFEARDGTSVPISLVYRRDQFLKGKNPIYVYGYGSYGYSMDPYFSSKRLSLLDRGFVFAIVHVRGGSELGRHWYESGRQFNKKNTFNDFIDGTQYLTKNGWGDADKVFAVGGSAGGLLMGVVVNEAPELYRGIVAQVPFVDVVTTMLDDSIPLTEGEYEEWGNPHIEKDYRYMLSYSPYDQVRKQNFPAMLVTTGLHDSLVQYFEPAKWVAKIREHNQSDNPILFKVEMDAGHLGHSGRYERYRQDALEYAFLLDQLNLGSE